MAHRREARLRFLTPEGKLVTYYVGLYDVHVHYEIDENESKHLLSVDNYGQQEATDAWVLLEEEKE